MRAFLVACAALILLAVPLRAGEVDRLMGALHFEETVEIMRAEGLRYGGDVGEEMLSPAERARWDRVVAGVYDAEQMLKQVQTNFAKAMEGADTGPLLAFFEGQGAEIVSLEIAGRRALLDDGTEAAAEVRYAELAAAGAPIVEKVTTLITDSDLIERNVAGALNANLVFYRGLADGGGLDLSEDEMLAEIWAQESEMREETRDWMQAYLTMAYQPLSQEVMDAYIALYQSPEGKHLNRALFAAFDAMYEELSYQLGLATALQMDGEDL
uniref:hypothetical protein n=1 Tax=Roseovarius sp. BRH_c41 TaxID=1629709 RepID=UPI0005F17AC1|nr:hypothetical protein [Roseovarius sp. BRH_c41]